MTRTYFIQAVDGGPIKIGVSVDPRKRLKSLQTSSHQELRIIGTLKGNREPELHEKFSELRLKGEWFRDDPKLKMWILFNAKTPRLSDRMQAMIVAAKSACDAYVAAQGFLLDINLSILEHVDHPGFQRFNQLNEAMIVLMSKLKSRDYRTMFHSFHHEVSRQGNYFMPLGSQKQS